MYTSCGGDITKLHSQIRYNDYGSYTPCYWFINSSVPIDIAFTRFNLPDDCRYTSMLIKKSGMLIGKYCRGDFPTNMTLSGNISVEYYPYPYHSGYGVGITFDIGKYLYTLLS